MINLVPGPDQQQLIDSAADFLASELPVERLASHGPNVKQEADAWDSICKMGWFNMSLLENSGGLGLTVADETLVFREIGRYLLSPNILATRLAVHAAHYAGDNPMFEKLTSGECRASVGLAKPASKFDAGTISGAFQLLDAENSRYVCIWNSDGLAVYDIAAFKAPRSVKSLDWSSNVQVTAAENETPRIWMPSADDAQFLTLEATVLGAGVLIGIAEGMRDLAVDYAKIREQFGKPIGSFQAVKHRCADMALRAETAWAQTVYAALSLTERYPMSAYEIHGARVLAAEAAIRNGEAAIQVHGGIGFTAEAKPHLYLKRAHTYNQVGGNIRHHQKRLIALDNLETAAN